MFQLSDHVPNTDSRRELPDAILSVILQADCALKGLLQWTMTDMRQLLCQLSQSQNNFAKSQDCGTSFGTSQHTPTNFRSLNIVSIAVGFNYYYCDEDPGSPWLSKIDWPKVTPPTQYSMIFPLLCCHQAKPNC